MIHSDNMTTPAMMSSAKNLNIRASLEPITGLKIELNADRVDTRSTDIYYMQAGMPQQLGGSFTMTTDDNGEQFEVADPWLTVDDHKLIDSDEPLDFLQLSPFRSTDLRAAHNFTQPHSCRARRRRLLTHRWFS